MQVRVATRDGGDGRGTLSVRWALAMALPRRRSALRHALAGRHFEVPVLELVRIAS